MIRALVALLGFAGAAALLAIAPEVASMDGTGLWWVYLVVGAAGLVAGALYQAGGIRSPGIMVNVPLFLLVFVPWTLLAIGLTSLSANPSSFAADWTDNLPDTVQTNWQAMLPAWWFGAGLLLAFALVEPRVRRRVTDEDAVVRRPGERDYGEDIVVARRRTFEEEPVMETPSAEQGMVDEPAAVDDGTAVEDRPGAVRADVADERPVSESASETQVMHDRR
jgi:hypothetical protein